MRGQKLGCFTPGKGWFFSDVGLVSPKLGKNIDFWFDSDPVGVVQTVPYGPQKCRVLTLSTTEAEYVALSTTLRDMIYILQLTTKIKSNGFNVPTPGPTKVTCRIFKDNAGTLELANNLKLRPQTKHITIPYHHFRHHVAAGTIKIEKISTEHQVVDTFTKPLPLATFQYLRKLLMGW